MQEYWVNVYNGVPAYLCSKQPTREASIDAMNKTTYNYPAYRIHVKMKEPKIEQPEIRVRVLGNCGKEHTYQEWQVCELCKALRYERSLFSDNWMG